MDQGESRLLRRLVVDRRLLALGVVADGAPYVGQVPFALNADGSALLIHVSRLAKHSRGLGSGAPWSGLLQLDDDGERDPLQMPRLTLEGTAVPLTRKSDEYLAGRSLYLDRLPSGAMTFKLGDFTLFELAIERGRLVAGFGHTLNVTAQHLRDLTPNEGEA